MNNKKCKSYFIIILTLLTNLKSFAQSESYNFAMRISSSIISIDYNDDKILLGDRDDHIYLYNLTDRDGFLVSTDYQVSLRSAKFIPNTNMIVIAYGDGALIFYDWFMRKTILTYYTNVRITSVAVSSNGEYLAVGGDENQIKLYRTNTIENISQLAEQQIDIHSSCCAIPAIEQVQFINTPNTLLIEETWGVYLWDIATNSISKLFDGEGVVSSAYYFERTNEILATFSDKFIIWDMSTASTLLERNLPEQPRFSMMLDDRIIIGYLTGNVETYSRQGVKLSTFSLLNEFLIAAFLSEQHGLILGFSNGSIMITQLSDG